MPTKTISREEFDIRLAQSTEQMRQKRSALEAQAAELEDLIGRYSSVLERLEAGNEKTDQDTDTSLGRRNTLRSLLNEYEKVDFIRVPVL